MLQLAATKPTLQQQIEVVTLSKFPLVKIDHEPAPPLPQVEGVKGKWTGHENEAFIEWNRIEEGVSIYNIYKAMTDPNHPDTVWQLAGTTTRCKITWRLSFQTHG